MCLRTYSIAKIAWMDKSITHSGSSRVPPRRSRTAGQGGPMPTARVLHRPLLPLVATVASLLLACSDTEEVPREPFNPPPDQTNKFLGYFTASDKLTACGNCHAEKQGDWANTKHAQAWGDLVASGHQTSDCNSCHSVSERGN